MAPTPTATDARLLVSRRQHARTMRSLMAIGGSMISLAGVLLAIGSAFSALDGDFFLLAGLGLIASGALLAKRHVAGVWTYMAVFAATLGWSVHDSGIGGSPIAYRIAGPIIMLVLIALLMPALLRWSHKRTVGVLAALIMATVMIGDFSNTDGHRLASSTGAASQSNDVQTKGVLQ